MPITPPPGGPAAAEPSYLVYTALLTQSGTDAPMATVLGTTTIAGSLTWTYVSVGRYRVENIGAFPEGRTAVFITPDTQAESAMAAVLAGRTTDDRVEIRTFDAAVAPIEMGGNQVTFEIRVYPAP